MGLIQNVFNTILYKPLLNALILIYQYLPGHDFGIAVIILTVIIRLILYPLMIQSIKSQKVLSELQPKIQEIQIKYKNEKEKQAKATMELYQKEKINPFGGCLPLLIQFPILIALYQVFWRGLRPEEMAGLYSFVPYLAAINPTFLGIVNLAKASPVFAVLAGVLQYFQTKMIVPRQQKLGGGQSSEKGNQMTQLSQVMQKQTLYFFPLFTVFILWRLPAAIGLYWIVTVLFSIIQQYLIYSKGNPQRG